MKKILSLSLLILFLYSCKIDNYTTPELQLSGKILNELSGELIPSSGPNNGSIIKIYEENSRQYRVFNTNSDGTFKNSKLFPANYRIVPEGPFKEVQDTVDIDVRSPETDVEFKVLPYVDLNITSSSDEDKYIIKLDYEKLSAESKVLRIGIVWSSFPFPDVTVFPEGDIISEDVSSEEVLKGSRDYEMSVDMNKGYFVRAFALTDNAGNYYNYSNQVMLNVE